MLVVASLQSRGQFVEGNTKIDGRFIDAGDADRATLPHSGRANGFHENPHLARK
jgi:hypothetical protein